MAIWRLWRGMREKRCQVGGAITRRRGALLADTASEAAKRSACKKCGAKRKCKFDVLVADLARPKLKMEASKEVG